MLSRGGRRRGRARTAASIVVPGRAFDHNGRCCRRGGRGRGILVALDDGPEPLREIVDRGRARARAEVVDGSALDGSRHDVGRRVWSCCLRVG